jgi:cell division protein ZapA
MAQISVTINGRSYPVACDEGEESRIRELARSIDNKVSAFARQVGQAGEARLLVLAALVLADEVAEVNEALRNLSDRSALPAAAPEDGALAAGVEKLAVRIEAVAARLESSHI